MKNTHRNAKVNSQTLLLISVFLSLEKEYVDKCIYSTQSRIDTKNRAKVIAFPNSYNGHWWVQTVFSFTAQKIIEVWSFVLFFFQLISSFDLF